MFDFIQMSRQAGKSKWNASRFWIGLIGLSIYGYQYTFVQT